MKLLKATGFILGRRKLGEADRLVTIFSKEFGKIQLIARSARKLRAKNIGKLEPYYLIDFQFVRGRTSNILTNVEIIKPYVFYELKYAKIILQTISTFTVEEQPDLKIFLLLQESFATLHKININILPYFKLKFWTFEGLLDTHRFSISKNQLDQLFFQIINNKLDYYIKMICSARDKAQINRLEKAVDLLENTIRPN